MRKAVIDTASDERVDRSGGSARAVVDLCKLGIVRMVTMTSAVGFATAMIVTRSGPVETGAMLLAGLWCVIGTALSAAGANALNQVMESRRDAAMHRTRGRPIPSGRLSRPLAAMIGAGLSLAGVAVLFAGNNAVSAGVSLATLAAYLLLYTPMKPMTPLATWVGAVPGALPPLIGWTAAAPGAWHGIDHPGGWSLFLIMFSWQIPHFLALAWKYREDYARGGYRVLSVVDPTGERTASTSFVWTVVMVGLSMSPLCATEGRVSWVYGAVAAACGAMMLKLAVRFWLQPVDARARGLFLGSLAYLPVVLVAIVADAILEWPG